jgi:hypothetical protein
LIKPLDVVMGTAASLALAIDSGAKAAMLRNTLRRPRHRLPANKNCDYDLMINLGSILRACTLSFVALAAGALGLPGGWLTAWPLRLARLGFLLYGLAAEFIVPA